MKTKNVVFLTLIYVFCIFLCFGCGGKTTVTVKNSTGTDMQAIAYCPTDGNEIKVTANIKNGASYKIKIDRMTEYSIFLIDAQNFRYGRSDYLFDKNSASIEIVSDNINVDGLINSIIDYGKKAIDYGAAAGTEIYNKLKETVDSHSK